MLKSLIFPGFILLVLAQWFVPGKMIWEKNNILSKGISYKFETAPVDPNNPFIGKYITLNFKETSLKLPSTKSFAYDRKVYVSFLKGSNGFARIALISPTKPDRADYLETTINYISDEKDSSTIFLNYPFTSYFMEEYKAPKAESIYAESRRDTSLKTYAMVSIYHGDAVVKDVYVNDSLINDVINSRNAVR